MTTVSRKRRAKKKHRESSRDDEDREHILTCLTCGPSFDMRDEKQLEHHEQEMHEPLLRH